MCWCCLFVYVIYKMLCRKYSILLLYVFMPVFGFCFSEWCTALGKMRECGSAGTKTGKVRENMRDFSRIIPVNRSS